MKKIRKIEKNGYWVYRIRKQRGLDKKYGFLLEKIIIDNYKQREKFF